MHDVTATSRRNERRRLMRAVLLLMAAAPVSPMAPPREAACPAEWSGPAPVTTALQAESALPDTPRARGLRATRGVHRLPAGRAVCPSPRAPGFHPLPCRPKQPAGFRRAG